MASVLEDMALIRIRFVLLLMAFSWLAAASSSYVKRKAGDQSPQHHCTKYNFGGLSGLHWYICCNNCGESPSNCDGRTYQGGSTTSYCNTCGVDSKAGDGKQGDSFRCGGCLGQDDVHSRCYTYLRKFPGFCWLYSDCFVKHCRDEFKKTDVVPDTCFNLKCDPGETVDNCPSDCCGTVNDRCVSNGTCLPTCCGISSCCSTGSTMPKSTVLISSVVILLYVGTL